MKRKHTNEILGHQGGGVDGEANLLPKRLKLILCPNHGCVVRVNLALTVNMLTFVLTPVCPHQQGA